MTGARAALWSLVKSTAAATLISVTISDRYATVAKVKGSSMRPTFEPELGDCALVERRRLDRYDFSHGDVVVFCYPTDHRRLFLNRLIALPGDWIQVPETAEIRQIPEGHCWVEGDNRRNSCWDSRNYGPVPLGLIRGRVTHIVWPPHRFGPVDRKMPEGRVTRR